jgi:hypothetical protein
LCLFTIANAQVIEDVLCEGRVFEPKCQQGTVIRVVAASYGNTDGAFCGGNDPEPWDTTVNCAVDVVEQVRQSCQGLSTCSLTVTGNDACVGTSKFLQVVWGCETGVPQNRVNNRNTNIMASSSPDKANPVTLHGQTVMGSGPYVFLEPAGNTIIEVRWFVDQTNLVVTVDDSAPYELYSNNRAWDTTQLSDGTHRVVAVISFADNTTGNIDATVTVRNGNNQQQNIGIAGAAVERASDTYTETATVNAVAPIVPKEVPWTLFGVAAIVAVILIVVIIVKSRSTSVN